MPVRWRPRIETKLPHDSGGNYLDMHRNSRLRVVDLKAVDLAKDKITYVPIDPEKKQDFHRVAVP